MKKSLLLITVATLAFVACNNESEFHQTYMAKQYQVVYADQTLDSVRYATTETHTISSDASWCTPIDQYQASINKQIEAHPGIYELAVYLNMKVNTTGKLRTAKITVNGGQYTASAMVIQLANLEVERPQVTLSPDLSGDTISTLGLQGLANTDSIIFHTQYPWTLSVPEGSFITLRKTSGEAGRNVVFFDYPKNPLTEARQEIITLKAFPTTTRRQTSDDELSEEYILTQIPIKQFKVESIKD